MLVRDGEGGDLMTVEQYGDFEMRFEWKITENGNSGVIYRIATTEPYPWHTGPEYQILHNARSSRRQEPDYVGGIELCRERAGEGRDASRWASGTRAASSRRGNHVEHWLNGVKVVEYEIGSADWESPRQGEQVRQDSAVRAHQARLHRPAGSRVNVVSYRNLKIKPL